MINLQERHQDHETEAYHFRKSFETWYGIAIKTRDDKDAEAVLTGLNKILADNASPKHQPAGTDGHIVFSTGKYNQDVIRKIREYARDCAQLSVILSGSYFDFLGRRWLDYAKEDYKL